MNRKTHSILAIIIGILCFVAAAAAIFFSIYAIIRSRRKSYKYVEYDYDDDDDMEAV